MLTMDKQNAIDSQLLGGIWILQTFPVIAFSLDTRWFHKGALLAGWGVGMSWGTVAACKGADPVTGKHLGGSLTEIPGLGDRGYGAMTAFAINLVVTVVLTIALNAARVSNGADETRAGDYFADAGDPGSRRTGRAGAVPRPGRPSR